jgi:hypothetical protein
LTHWIDVLEMKFKEGKKILISCGKKEKPQSIILALTERVKIPKEQVLILTAENIDKHRDCSEWKQYSIVMYSPCIQAGVSFEDLHFDSIFCFFSRLTGDYDDALQSANRVRCIKDNEYHLYIEGKDKKNDYFDINNPFNTREMERVIDETDKNTFSLTEWKLKPTMIHAPTRELIKNPYYYLHLNILVSDNINKAFMKTMVQKRFKEQGVVCKEIEMSENEIKSKEFYDERNDEINAIKGLIRDADIMKIVDAEPINNNEAGHLKVKPKKTEKEIYQLKRHCLKNIFHVQDDEITYTFVMNYKDGIKKYKTLSKFCNFLQKDIGHARKETDPDNIVSEMNFKETNFSDEFLQEFSLDEDNIRSLSESQLNKLTFFYRYKWEQGVFKEVPDGILNTVHSDEMSTIKEQLENQVNVITIGKYKKSLDKDPMNTIERLRIKKYPERHLELIRILHLMGFTTFFPNSKGENVLEKSRVKYDEMIKYMISNKKKHNCIDMLPSKINWNTLDNEKTRINRIHKFLNFYLDKDFGLSLSCIKDTKIVSLSGIDKDWVFDRETYTIKPKIQG